MDVALDKEDTASLGKVITLINLTPPSANNKINWN